jgi:kynureninase
MSSEIDALATRLRPHYSRFLDAVEARGEVLLTGHSHQAWPDVAREAQLEAWDDAARLIDDKWDRVFGELIPELQGHIAKRIGSSRPGDIAIGQNTHELVYRLSTCFPHSGPIVTTDSEFHSLRRQLARFEEGRTPVVETSPGDASTFMERFLEATEKTRPAWVALSYVLFTTSRIVTSLTPILDELARRSIPVLVDAYHAFNVLDFEADKFAGSTFVTGGGYKYAECGEGVCFLLLPESARALRPRYTGWFSHFESLESKSAGGVEYGEGGYRFLGSTFDPTSLYRAVRVLRFMDEIGLTPRVLREQSLRQTALIIERYDALGLASKGITLRTPREARGGFVALETPRAKELSAKLREKGVRTDVRGDLLRLGPAPYLRAEVISRAMDLLASLADRRSDLS